MKRYNKKFKKIYSVIVALVMVLSVMGGTGLVSYAATELDVIEVTLTNPLVNGNTEVVYSVDPSANYTVTSTTTRWKDGGNVDEAYEFYEGDTYCVAFQVTPAAGYEIGQNTKVLVNGSDANVNLLGGYDTPASGFEYAATPQLLGIIDAVDFPAFPAGAIGDAADDYFASGTNYSISGFWELYNRETQGWEFISGSHTFASGNICRYNLSATPAPGYKFADLVNVTVGGQEPGSYGCSPSWLGISKTVSHATEITEIIYDKDSVSNIKIGDTYDGSAVNIKVPSGSNYTGHGYWYDENGNTPTVFEDGKKYELFITFLPAEGYCFAERVSLNGGGMGTDGAMVHDVIVKSFKEVIDEVVVTGVSEPVVGKDIQDMTLTVPSGAKYTAKGTWYNSDGSVASGKFEEGKSYNLTVMAMAGEGAEFSYDTIITIDGISYKPSAYDASTIFYDLNYSFCQKIDKIEVTGFKEPVVGDVAAVDNLKVPSGANYEIADVVWIDWNTGEVSTKFEKGHAYVMDVTLVPKAGYEFSLDAVVTLDGEDITTISNVRSDIANFGVDYWFKDVVTEVKLDNVQNPSVGAKSTTDVKVPSGANYNVSFAEWSVWNDQLQDYEPFTGIFEAGKAYKFYVNIEPKDGYMFDVNTTVYINGVENDIVAIYAEGINLDIYYSPELKIIDVVKVTIAPPMIGGHASINPVVKLPEGANYSISTNWYPEPQWIKGDADGWNYYNLYFKENDSYGVLFNIIANQGYVFAENLQVIVNGAILHENNVYSGGKMADIIYFYDEECNHSYSDWKDAGDGTHVRTCEVCGYKDCQSHTYDGTKCSICGNVKSDDSPKTGDNSYMPFVFVLMVICGAGVVVLGEAKKRNNR